MHCFLSYIFLSDKTPDISYGNGNTTSTENPGNGKHAVQVWDRTYNSMISSQKIN